MKFRGGVGLGRDTLLLSLGRYGQFAVTLITLPIIARSLSVTDFGIYAIGSGLYFLGSIYIDWGLSLPLGARVRASGWAEGESLRATFLIFRLWAFVPIFGSAAIMVMMDGNVVLVLAFLAGGISSLGEEWLLVARGKFLDILYCQWAGRALYLGIVFLALPLWQSVFIPFVGLLLGAFLSALLSWRFAGRPKIRRGPYRAGFIAMFRLGLPSVLAKCLTNLSGTSLPVVLALNFPLRTIGIYNGSDRLIRAGVSALDSFVVAQFHRVNSKLVSDEYSMRLFAQICILSLVSGTFLTITIWIFAPTAETPLYGDSLPGVTDVLKVGAFLVPAAALVSTINTNVFSVTQKTGPMLVSSAAACVVLLGLLLLSPSDWSAVEVAVCVVIAEWSGALVAFTLGLRVVSKRPKGPAGELRKV